MRTTHYDIDCVLLRNQEHRPEAILFLGNASHGWMLSTDSIKQRIASGHSAFYVTDVMMGKKLPIVIADGRFGLKVLTAYHSNRAWDTLLGLPTCQDLRLID